MQSVGAVKQNIKKDAWFKNPLKNDAKDMFLKLKVFLKQNMKKSKKKGQLWKLTKVNSIGHIGSCIGKATG